MPLIEHIWKGRASSATGSTIESPQKVENISTYFVLAFGQKKSALVKKTGLI